MNYTIEDVLRCFEVQGKPSTWRGLLKYVVRCPNAARHKHGDRNPSAALFFDIERGTVGYKCYAGCTRDEAFAAVDLPSNLTVGIGDGSTRNGKRSGNGAKIQKPGQTYENKSKNAKYSVVKTYELKNRRGELIAIQERLEGEKGAADDGKPPKKFRYKLPTGEYGLGGKLTPSDLPLYGVHLLQNGCTVAIHEGAKCADAHREYLDAIGETDIVPVAYVGGANALPSDAVLSELSGVAEIVIHPDHDEPGRVAALKLGERLQSLLPDTPIAVWQWRNAPDGGDFADWFELFNGDAPDEALDDTFVPFETYAAQQRMAKWRARFPGTLYTLEEAETMEFPELEFLPFLGQPGYIARGYAILLSAYAKVGKTELVCWNVREWLLRGEKVLYLTEESAATFVRRAKRMGWFDAAKKGGGELLFWCAPSKATRDDVVEFILDHPEYSVVVCDTLRKVARFTNENDNSIVWSELEPLIEAATRVNKQTLLMVHHESKSGGQDGRGIAGGHAIVGAVDAFLEVRKHPRHKTHRIVTGHAREYEIADLLYCRTEDNRLEVLGNPEQVENAELRRNVLSALAAADEFRTKKEIHNSLDDCENVEIADVERILNKLTEQGYAVRDPKEPKPGKTYKWKITEKGLQHFQSEQSETTQGQR
jgi:hypothetical protein